MDEDLSMETPALGYSHALPPGGTCGAASGSLFARMGFVVSLVSKSRPGAPAVRELAVQAGALRAWDSWYTQHSSRMKQGDAIICVMENPDGWSFICKLCDKKHEVPEEIAPYWKDAGTLTRIPAGEVTLGCSEKPGTAQYLFSDFTAFRVV